MVFPRVVCETQGNISKGLFVEYPKGHHIIIIIMTLTYSVIIKIYFFTVYVTHFEKCIKAILVYKFIVNGNYNYDLEDSCRTSFYFLYSGDQPHCNKKTAMFKLF